MTANIVIISWGRPTRQEEEGSRQGAESPHHQLMSAIQGVVRWSGGQVVRWSGGQVARWSGGDGGGGGGGGGGGDGGGVWVWG